MSSPAPWMSVAGTRRRSRRVVGREVSGSEKRLYLRHRQRRPYEPAGRLVTPIGSSWGFSDPSMLTRAGAVASTPLTSLANSAAEPTSAAVPTLRDRREVRVPHLDGLHRRSRHLLRGGGAPPWPRRLIAIPRRSCRSLSSALNRSGRVSTPSTPAPICLCWQSPGCRREASQTAVGPLATTAYAPRRPLVHTRCRAPVPSVPLRGGRQRSRRCAWSLVTGPPKGVITSQMLHR